MSTAEALCLKKHIFYEHILYEHMKNTFFAKQTCVLSSAIVNIFFQAIYNYGYFLRQ
jgi:hypothetical protein